jgi:hypothetical protein
MPTPNKPNFFIVGAPKCGTTALYSYLAGHPDVGMSKNKEPHFFATDVMSDQRPSPTLSHYLSNFDHAAKKKRIGEASTSYLASRIAPEAILKFTPDAQIIVMVRNPINALHAMHSQRLRNGCEHITQFEVAVDSEETRYWQSRPFRGKPVLNSSYRETIRFVEQIQRYFNVFGRERVHVIVFDDLASAPRAAYLKVLSFLGLPDDDRRNFKIVNGNKRIRSQTVQNGLRYLSRKLWRMEQVFPTWCQEARDVAARLNYVHEPRPAMDAAFRQQLEMEYASEIRDLEDILQRNLNHWLTRPNRSLATIAPVNFKLRTDSHAETQTSS